MTAFYQHYGRRAFKDFILEAYEGDHGYHVECTYPARGGATVGLLQLAPVYGETIYHDDEEHTITRPVIALKGWDVGVRPDFQRRGIAKAMYAYAREMFKLPIRAGDFQTPDGERLLAEVRELVK
jgi:ribosomal protein S18 acetylase RimI-like enzyme